MRRSALASSLNVASGRRRLRPRRRVLGRSEQRSVVRSRKHRVYPYTGLMVCSGCGASLSGTPNRHGTPRMVHPSSNCPDKSYHSLKTWDQQIDETIVADVALLATWRVQVNALLRQGQEEDQSKQQRTKLEQGLGQMHNLYKIDDAYND